MEGSVKHKTVRKSHSTFAAVEEGKTPQSPTSLESFLDTNASEAYRRPWHKLEAGLRRNRVRKFIESETQRMALQDADIAHLTSLLLRALDRKALNSKTTVLYDQDSEEIKEIRGLVYHTTAEGRTLSQLVEKKGAVTFRKRNTASAAAAAAQLKGDGM